MKRYGRPGMIVRDKSAGRLPHLSAGGLKRWTQHFILRRRDRVFRWIKKLRIKEVVYGFSALEKAEVWDRWARGESLKAIGRGFGKPSSSIRGQLSPSGGIRPACPSSKQMGLLSVFHKGGSGSSLCLTSAPLGRIEVIA